MRPAVEACAAMLLALAATANDAPAPEAPPPSELLMYLAEFEADPVAVDAAMARDGEAGDAPDDAAPERDDTDTKKNDDAPR